MLVSQCRLVDLQEFIQLGHLSLANLPLLEPTERFSMLNTVDSDSNVIIILIQKMPIHLININNMMHLFLFCQTVSVPCPWIIQTN